MTGLRKAALAAITLLVAAASAASFAESYRALLDWATRHGLHGVWAYAWPLQVDTFIAVGELALLVALADSWPARSRAAAWGVTLLGPAVSVAGNVGHVAAHDWASRATAAVPPIAAAAALAVGLGVLKRVVANRTQTAPLMHPAPEPRTDSESAPGLNGRAHLSALRDRPRNGAPKRTRAAPVTATHAESEFMSELASGAVPSLRSIRSRLHVGQDRAKQIRDHLETVGTRT
jgi:hypothetical protein